MKILDPQKIEEKSFEIIDRFFPDLKLPLGEKAVVKRVIHATTDLSYAKELSFHPEAIEAGLRAIKKGKDIICDVSMVKAGINANLLSEFGGKVICLINDKDIIRKSAQLKIARAILSMRKAAKFMDGAIVSIGNAPTALFELCDLIKQNKVRPALVIGIPVGFVGAVESKKILRSQSVPYISNRNRKGGSCVAAAIVNALLKIAEGR